MGGSTVETERASRLIRALASACGVDPKLLIMLSAYCGDSGMQGGPHCFLGGYVADVDRWANFADKWQALCDKHIGGQPLTMATARLSDAVLAEFAECIVEHVQTEMWTAAPEYYLNKLREKHGIRYDKYRLCFLGLLERTVADYSAKDDSLTWWFADTEGSGDHPITELKVSLFKAFADAKTLSKEGDKRLFHSISFADDKSTLPLQAARFLVDLKHRYHSDDSYDAQHVHPAYQVLRDAPIKRVELVWFDHTLEDSMNRLRDAEVAD